MRRTACRLALLLALVAAASCGETEQPAGGVIEAARAAGRLVVAHEPEFPPFEWKDDTGKAVGFDVDLARELGEALGVEVVFREVKWDVIVAELLLGRVDLIVSGMTVTPEREESVAFTEPYYRTTTVLLAGTERGGDVRRVEDLDAEGRIVVTKLGTTGEQAAREKCPRATIRTYPTESAAALEVAQGRADAFLYDRASLERHHAQHPRTTRLLPEPVTVEPYAIALRRGDPASVEWLNRFLANLRARGRLKELYARHGLDDPDER
jgi:polar amino acid transport system substrate-binding protein